MVAHRALEQGMFSDSLLETSHSEYALRSWSTLSSFLFEALAIGLLLLLPLWKTIGLPAVRTISTPLSLGHRMPDSSPAQPVPHTHSLITTILPNARLTMPKSIPTTIDTTPDTAAPMDPIGYNVGPSGDSSGSESGILTSLLNVNGPHPPSLAATPKPAASVPHFRTSVMLQGNLIRRVDPVYPPIARNARVQGAVVLEAWISKAGTIENLRAVSGHPLLVPAAIDAVQQWRYRPYILNEEPIEVETQITVNFILSN